MIVSLSFSARRDGLVGVVCEMVVCTIFPLRERLREGGRERGRERGREEEREGGRKKGKEEGK